jgi:hypothetical protein
VRCRVRGGDGAAVVARFVPPLLVRRMRAADGDDSPPTPPADGAAADELLVGVVRAAGKVGVNGGTPETLASCAERVRTSDIVFRRRTRSSSVRPDDGGAACKDRTATAEAD